MPGALWFARETASGHMQWLKANLADGAISPAFDATELAHALRQAGVAVDAGHLELPLLHEAGGAVRFVLGGRFFAWRDGRLAELPEQEALPALRSNALPLRTDATRSGTGDTSTRIGFLNRTGAPVRIFWLDVHGVAKPLAQCAAGREIVRDTYGGHAFECRNGAGALLWRGLAARNGWVVLEGAAPAPETNPAPAPPCPVRMAGGNLWLEGKPATADGGGRVSYEESSMAPDGARAAGLRVARVEPRRITLVESSPRDQLQPRVRQIAYPKPGDPVDECIPWLLDVHARRMIPVDTAPFAGMFDVKFVGWSPKGDEALYLCNRRGHQRLQVLAVAAADGRVREVVGERSATFIDYAHKTCCRLLPQCNGLLWMSERDGWNHLWRYDMAGAKTPVQISTGPWVVRAVESVDEAKGQVLVAACGLAPGQDPCHIHLARCSLSGGPAQLLTAGDGTHQWSFSPDGACFIDSWSRVDQPPVHELRRTSDGSLVCELARADDAALRARGWRPPERFSAKGRDGTTDIWGVIYRPPHPCPGVRLPVIEEIYPGPHGQYVPKAFFRQTRAETVAAQGYAVVIIDGMGTNWRSRAFHDVCWKNLKDGGFPDRIAWMKSAAVIHPELDLSKVGVYGGSAGGQAALAALLHHPEFYKVAVSDCGCHDNRMDKIWWNEAWMGWPVGPEYADNSNVTHAAKLQGDLLLTVGELDQNVDPSSTFQVVDALLKAGKEFEFVCVPGAGHFTLDRPEIRRRMLDFFRRKIPHE